VRRAKAYLTGAIAASGRLTVGAGHGPVHHFHALWTEDQAE
jgi:hydroxymethylpyrimidine/phosphomethylpyrimidine kinase